jgi:hypothetical protein
VPAPLSARVIDLARNQTRVFQAGAVTVPMTSQTLAGERYLADSLIYAFLVYLRADIQLAQPAAFVVDTGVRG